MKQSTTYVGSDAHEKQHTVAMLRPGEDEAAVCEVIVASLIPVKPGERIKTDRRDAKKLDGHRHDWETLAAHLKRTGRPRPPGLATVDSDLARRSTAMSALPRATAVIHGYQSDSSSKPPVPSSLPRLSAPSRSRRSQDMGP